MDFSYLVMMAVLAFLYFAPSLMAWMRDSPSTFAIFLLNLMLGWTLLGWIIAMVWAAAGRPRPAASDPQRE